jgi:hypothetical protein
MTVLLGQRLGVSLFLLKSEFQPPTWLSRDATEVNGAWWKF